MNTDLIRRSIPDGLLFSSWHAADGWTLRRFDWPVAAARGSLLFVGGRGDFVEKYLEAFHHWHARGWNLTGFDWRGQGGSGRILTNRLICHMPDFDPLLDDLHDFVRDWRKMTPGPHAIIAHSMGAHLALRLLVERREHFHRVALTSPMIGIAVHKLPTRAVALAAKTAILLGLKERTVWNGDPAAQRGHMTSCPHRHEDKLWWKAEQPEIASGPASWGWLHAACSSIGKLPLARLSSITSPVLMLASRRDPVIDVSLAMRAAAALPNGLIEVLDSGGHELLREVDRLRLPALARIDSFFQSG